MKSVVIRDTEMISARSTRDSAVETSPVGSGRWWGTPGGSRPGLTRNPWSLAAVGAEAKPRNDRRGKE
jgi:hypothetical protein